MELLSKAKAGYEGFLSSMSEIGSLNIGYMEKMTEHQMASSKYVADLGFEHMKTLIGVSDLESAKALPSATLELGSKLAKKTMEDYKMLMEEGASYKNDVLELFKKKTEKAAA